MGVRHANTALAYELKRQTGLDYSRLYRLVVLARTTNPGAGERQLLNLVKDATRVEWERYEG